MRKCFLLGLLVSFPGLLLAHTGAPVEPHDLWCSWEFAPGVIFPLLISAALYARGSWRPWTGSRFRSGSFWSGWVILSISLVSPLHALGESLFSAHMLQHELLMLGAAPLLVFSRPLVPLLWGLPLSWRRAAGQFTKTRLIQRSWRELTRPLTAWWIHAAALWLWHAPRLFEATLQSDSIHAAQHATFLGSSLLFWWSLFYARGRAGHGLGVLYIFTTAVHTSILGALLTFAPHLWYGAYGIRAAALGLSPLEDQQVGGLIMWVPGGIVYVGVGVSLFAAWLQASGVRTNLRGYADLK